ncbi:MAG: hypothetical protein GXP51_04950 [Deltaproteobacteria bacterium]|nr:hypothetical protein [Deltaproteobacteria bacterium]
MPIIICPHCGTRRNTPPEKLPRKATRAHCPHCNKTFIFDPASARHEVSVKTTVQPVTCPHCGLPREIPKVRQADRRATVSCRRCRGAFRIEQGQTGSASTTQVADPRQLTGISELLTDSWELFCQRGWGLLTTGLLTSLLIFTPLLLATLLLPKFLVDNRSLLRIYLLFGVGYSLLGSAWIFASMFSHVCNRQLGVIAALAQGRRQLWKFAGLLLLLGLIVTGGSLLLIIPGVIFIVWFSFCQFILAEEGISGRAALEKSRQLVEGYWWQIFGRFLLLLLIILAISTLTARLPVIGTLLNVTGSLLLIPFSLFYCFLLYQDLKRCRQPSAPAPPSGQWLPLMTALFGWTLIPALLFFVNHQQNITTTGFTTASSAVSASLFTSEQDARFDPREEQIPRRQLPSPEPLTTADYDRLLSQQHLTAPQQGVNLGPATLSAEHFWSDRREPHLWLKLQLAELPNLALAHRRSTRIRIDKVLDVESNNRYNPEHSFENSAFQWIDILSDDSSTDGYSGIRNVYLKQGTRPEQIRSISGRLELHLPLGIKTLRLSRSDIGKSRQVAGKRFTLETLSKHGIALSFRGKRSDLLSIRAINQQAEPLREAGITWQRTGDTISLKQMFSGNIDTVTLLVASDSVTRSYPFEIIP